MPDLQQNTVDTSFIKKGNLTGFRFSNLIVIEYAGKSASGTRKWKCLCNCGKETIVLANNLRSGKTKSCGCGALENMKNNWALFTKHGLRKHPLHHIWTGLKGRCYNSKNEKFKDYGGRGISVCEEWRDNFKVFYDWCIENGWREGLSIDRKNNDGNYEPLNCRWVTLDVQANNKRTSFFITYNGETKTAAQWGTQFKMPSWKIIWRVNKGWPLDKVFLVKKEVIYG